MPFGAHILDLLEAALAESFQYHGGLNSFVQRSGVAASRLATIRKQAEDRNKLSGRFPKAPKRFVAQELLKELSSGAPEDDRILGCPHYGIL